MSLQDFLKIFDTEKKSENDRNSIFHQVQSFELKMWTVELKKFLRIINFIPKHNEILETFRL